MNKLKKDFNLNSLFSLGNMLTIIILLRPNLRQYTTMRYLTVVAVADLCSLYSWNLNLFYKHLINPYQNDLEDASIISCRLVSFIAFVSLELSSWYLTLMSVDRCLNIHFLFWNKQYGRAKYSIYIILVTTIIILCLNTHLLFLNGYKVPDCTPYAKRTCFKCYERPNDPNYIFPKWEKIHVIVYNFIPFSIMLISTFLIIRRSVSSTNKHRRSSTKNNTEVNRNDNRQRRQRQLTCILLSVIFLFVSLTTPVMIYNVFLRNNMQTRKPLKYIIQGVLLCIQFTSHAVSFIKTLIKNNLTEIFRSIFLFIVMVQQNFVRNLMNSFDVLHEHKLQYRLKLVEHHLDELH